jgi:VIT1/CCC1 family predicted Fe2+/Mn2+ transporter
MTAFDVATIFVAFLALFFLGFASGIFGDDK